MNDVGVDFDVAGMLADVAAVIGRARVGDTARLDAELLVGHVAGLDRVGLRVHGDRLLDGAQLARLDTLVARRSAGEPIAYLLGSAWFHGREFLVDRRVLVPRPETEQLVDLALEHVARRAAAERTRPVRVVDACTGSGCVAISIAADLGARAVVIGTDICADALDVARENARRHAPRVQLLVGDLLEPAREHGPFDVVTANPPYVEGLGAPQLQPSVRAHEPHVALFAPEGGIRALYGRLAAESVALLRPGGLLAVEHGHGQRDEVVAAMVTAGLVGIEGLDDLAGIDRVVAGRAPG